LKSSAFDRRFVTLDDLGHFSYRPQHPVVTRFVPRPIYRVRKLDTHAYRILFRNVVFHWQLLPSQ
jgi:uncharacterized protein YcbX